jgi:hypothetical protein
VTGSGTLPGYRSGEEGTVKQGSYPAPSGGNYDIAQMANHAGGTDYPTRESKEMANNPLVVQRPACLGQWLSEAFGGRDLCETGCPDGSPSPNAELTERVQPC